MTGRRRLAIGVLALLALGAAPPPARARRRLRFHGQGMAGRGAYGPDVLTVDALQDCLRATARINADMDAIDRDERMLEATRVDSRDPVSVARYNAAVDRFNGRVEGLNASIDGFNARCAGKRYYEADMKQAEEKTGLRR